MKDLNKLRADFTAAKSNKSVMTHKQGGYLWRFTGCKLWQPEQIPPPSLMQASVLIDACVSWNAAKGSEKQAIASVIEEFMHLWFPDWDKKSLYFRMKSANNNHAPQKAETSSKPPFPALPDAEKDEVESQENSEGENKSECEAENNSQPEEQTDADNQGDSSEGEKTEAEGSQGKQENAESSEESENENEGSEQSEQSEGEQGGDSENSEESEESEQGEQSEGEGEQGEQEQEQEQGEGEQEQEQEQPKPEKKKKKSKLDPTVEEMLKLYNAGLRNIWMVGPAGCGKTTMAGELAKILDVPCTVISCGMGTSAVEFLGYKYPERESTPFAGAFGQASVIVLDEFTALDPSVAQVANAALANGEINTTTGVVERDANCLIIATSNTFGDGADRQYVANMQLDAATIDRFVGGIINVGYSKQYEKRFDAEVRNYVLALRKIITKNSLRRVASTRMMIQGESLKNGGLNDWRPRLIINWTEEEKSIVSSTLGVAMVEAKQEIEEPEF